MSSLLMTAGQAINQCFSQSNDTILVETTSTLCNGRIRASHSSSASILNYLQINVDQFERPGDWRLKPKNKILSVLARQGLSVSQNKTIIIFDNLRSVPGANTARFDASARLFCLLKRCGFSKLNMIHDESWFGQNTVDFRHHSITGNDNALALNSEAAKSPYILRTHLEELLSRKAGAYRLLDARTPQEYDGLTTGYSYIDVAGKIPSAENFNSNDYIATHGEPLSSLRTRLDNSLKAKGISKQDKIIWYCGTSWRASRMHVLSCDIGYKNSVVYDGGWYEWHRVKFKKHSLEEVEF